MLRIPLQQVQNNIVRDNYFQVESAFGEIAHQPVLLTLKIALLLLSTLKWNVHDTEFAWQLPQASFQPYFSVKTSHFVKAEQFPDVLVVL